jgi:hypothetical protein
LRSIHDDGFYQDYFSECYLIKLTPVLPVWTFRCAGRANAWTVKRLIWQTFATGCMSSWIIFAKITKGIWIQRRTR